MLTWRSFAEAAAGLNGRATALTIGTFDGVHLGHQAVVRELCRWAGPHTLLSLVVTFAQHPAFVVSGEAPPLLIPVQRRLEYLAELGLQAALVLAFDSDLAVQEPAVFARQRLCGDLGARAVVVGPDFRFGARGSGNAGLLVTLGEEYGFEVRQVPPVVMNGTTVSSTVIRWMLAAGDVSSARLCLGRNFAVRGQIIPGNQRGRKLGFPTANLTPAPGSLWPRYGVYLVRVALDRPGQGDRGQGHYGLANVGVRPTFGQNAPGIEVYLLSYHGDLYGATIDLAFLHFLRPEERFADAPALQAQIAVDIRQAEAMLQADGSAARRNGFL